ncbi:hypothetical protein PIB30_060632 [Stylosanthes scabra]|uniref:LAGLIDADG homing endonuclease n=1 Tax=Stylosanthes scabra TaxID=79078 RepID=A0ABU6ZJC6_9FABA|nr:hypothetical protein [Stylosanthes scabra]
MAKGDGTRVTKQVDDEPTPLGVIPSEAWTQPHGVELYGWVATEVLGTRSKMTKEYLEEMLKSNIAFSPNHNNKKERIFFINHRVGDVPDWLRYTITSLLRWGFVYPLPHFSKRSYARA